MATTNDDGVETIPLDDISDGSETVLRRNRSSRMLSKTRTTMQHLAFYGICDGRYSLFLSTLLSNFEAEFCENTVTA